MIGPADGGDLQVVGTDDLTGGFQEMPDVRVVPSRFVIKRQRKMPCKQFLKSRQADWAIAVLVRTVPQLAFHHRTQQDVAVLTFGQSADKFRAGRLEQCDPGIPYPRATASPRLTFLVCTLRRTLERFVAE